MKEELLKLTIGALLHDIGKVVQRSGGYSGTHSKIGGDYLKEKLVNDDIILSSAYHHHAREIKTAKDVCNLSYITYIADNIASASDRRNKSEELIEDESRSFDPKTQLQSVFSLLCEETVPMYHNPYMLDYDKHDINYPKEEKIGFDNSFYKNIVDRIAHNLKDFTISEDYVNSLLEILEATLSFVPSSTNVKEVSDISLYDHVKITAAVASCIYLYLQDKNISEYENVLFKNEGAFKEEKFAIIYSAQISGIQDFIYTIHSKGALKTLRARSFYLELLSNVLIDEILKELNLTRANLLYSGGGNFYMILPNTKEVLEKIEKIIKKANKILLENFDNSLYIADGYGEASYNSLQNENKTYEEMFKDLSKMVSEKKLKRYTYEDIAYLNNKHVEGSECRVCHTVSPHGDTCKFCDSLINFSTDIIDIAKQFYALTDSKINSNSIEVLGKYITALTKTEILDELKKEKILFYSKNSFFQGEGLSSKLWVGDYFKEKDISDYAKTAEGVNRVSVLRLDVDNLGDAFTKGFNYSDGVYNTISRTSTLSRSLSMFFKWHINKILRDIDANVTIVYAGGDDMFLIGAWDSVINCAIEINNKFAHFTSEKLKISAGIGIFPNKHPVKNMAKVSESLEKISKSLDKNRITLFDEDLSFTWDEFNSVIEKRDLFEKTLSEHEKGATFAYKLLDYLRSLGEKDAINLARLAYTLSSLDDVKLSNYIYKNAQNKEKIKQMIAAIYLYSYKNREVK